MRRNQSGPLENTIHFAVLLAVVLASSPRGAADAVTEWNEQALSCTLTAKQLPFAATRSMAMVHVAMFDAVNSIQHGYTPYKVSVAATSESSPEAAAIAAAHTVLIKLFPDQATMLEAAYSASLARIADGTAKAAGVAVGEKVARSLGVARNRRLGSCQRLQARDNAWCIRCYDSADRFAMGQRYSIPPGTRLAVSPRSTAFADKLPVGS